MSKRFKIVKDKNGKYKLALCNNNEDGVFLIQKIEDKKEFKINENHSCKYNLIRRNKNE